MLNRLILILLLLTNVTHASEGRINVSVNVTCDCLVDGIVVQINDAPCMPTCDNLKKNKDTSMADITIKDNQKIVTYY